MRLTEFSLIAGAGASVLRRQDERLGRTPALGWNGWNQGGCDAATAETALTTARNFISLGLKDAGYLYVNIDDCWSLKERDSAGSLVADPAKFPQGVKAVADEIHAMGLKFGLYGDAGRKTCADYPGSQDHEEQDADLLASWGVDFWKYDNCYTPCNDGDDIHTCPIDSGPTSRPLYEKMRDALAGTSIFYSLCNWGWDEVWTWGRDVGQSWRMSVDNWGNWEDVVRIANSAAPISNYSAPYGFNDLDMMILGNGRLTAAEERTHFVIWAVSKSPIILGTDIGKLSESQIQLITNKALLAVNQDSLGVAATSFTPAGALAPDADEILPYWVGPLSDGHVVALVASKDAGSVSVNLQDVPGLDGSAYSWIELLSGETGSGTSVGKDLELHDVAVYKITPA